LNPEILKWVKIVVSRTIKEKKLRDLDQETLLSAGYLGYSQSVNRFDETLGIKFKTFAEHRIKGAVLDEVRKMIGDERYESLKPTQVEELDLAHYGDESESALSIETRVDIDSFFRKAPISLRDKEILKSRVYGFNLDEIAAKYNIGRERVRHVLRDIKEQMSLWFKDYVGANFKLVNYNCPECNSENETLEFATAFDCEKCKVEVKIVNGKAQLG